MKRSIRHIPVGVQSVGRLHAVILDTSGNVVSDTFGPLITGDTPWTKYAVSFKPTVSGKVKIRLEMTNASGIAKFDDVRLPGVWTDTHSSHNA